MANFCEVEFFGDANFSFSSFLGVGGAIFCKAKFSRNANFSDAEFVKKLSFEKCEFESDADFYGSTFCDCKISFEEAFFKGKSASFNSLKFVKDCQLSFENALFKGTRADFSSNKKSESLAKINLNGAIFHCPASFNLKFTTCPDFSKARFLSKVFIEENWPTPGSKIGNKPEDLALNKANKIRAGEEEKFRFSKKIFRRSRQSLQRTRIF